MNTGGFGVQTIVNYGNGGSTNGALPAIDHSIYVGGPLNFGAPSLANAKRMPIIERITPRNVNATKMLETARSRSLVTATTTGKMITSRLAGGGRAIAIRIRDLRSA